MLTIQSDEHYMGEALKQAEQAYLEGEVPIGAVVVCKGKIIAKAYNQVERLTDPTAHAEMLAITAATNALGAKYLPECTLYVTLEPCAMCAGASSWAQLAGIVIGAVDEKRGFRVLNEKIAHPKTKIVTGIRAQECKALIDKFFQGLRGNN